MLVLPKSISAVMCFSLISMDWIKLPTPAFQLGRQVSTVFAVGLGVCVCVARLASPSCLDPFVRTFLPSLPPPSAPFPRLYLSPPAVKLWLKATDSHCDKVGGLYPVVTSGDTAVLVFLTWGAQCCRRQLTFRSGGSGPPTDALLISGACQWPWEEFPPTASSCFAEFQNALAPPAVPDTSLGDRELGLSAAGDPSPLVHSPPGLPPHFPCPAPPRPRRKPAPPCCHGQMCVALLKLSLFSVVRLKIHH